MRKKRRKRIGGRKEYKRRGSREKKTWRRKK